MTSAGRAPALGLLVVLAVATARPGLAARTWSPQPQLVEVSYVGALDVTEDVRAGAALLPLWPPLSLGRAEWDGVLVGEGFVQLVRLPDGGVPPSPHGDPELEGPAPPLPAVGPRLEVLARPVQLAAGGTALAVTEWNRLAVRWTSLRVPGARGAAIVEVLIEDGALHVQYLHVPDSLRDDDLAPSSATAFRLMETRAMRGETVELEPGLPGDVVLEPPRRLPAPQHADPPPAGCEPATGTWCDTVGDQCSTSGGTSCATRVEDRWSFGEGGFCRDCRYTLYVLVECGREMHFPMYDMEGFDLTVTNMVTGQRPPLRCVNDTARGNGAANSWRGPPSCGTSQPGPWWSPPLDVTDNAGAGHVVASDANPGDGECTTRFDVECSALPATGVAATVVYGEEQVIDCFVQDPEGLCGIYRIDMISGGHAWQLFSNCDGTDTSRFDIYFDCTEAWAAYSPLPELAITNASAPGLCYTYDVTFDIENIGCVDEPGDVPVRITSDCGDVRDVLVAGPIPAHGRVTHVERMTLSCPDAALHLVADPDDNVLECTESATAAACEAEVGNDELDTTTECCPLAGAGADKAICEGESVALSDASSQFGDVFLWDDGGAGGTFSPGPDVRNPTYTPPPGAPPSITLTLAVTYSGSGCRREDALLLQVNPQPVVDAGTAKTACAGAAVALADATVAGGDLFEWTDGGAGGSFSPSSAVRNPTYLNATPGVHALTLRSETSAAGCESFDTVTVTIVPEPVVAAGADRAICADDTVTIDDASLGSAHAAAWSDGGAGGTFTPSARAPRPTYAPPGPGTFTLTLAGTEIRPGAPVTGTPLRLDDFEAGVGPGWSSTTTEDAPAGGRRYLGRFSGSDAVTLDLASLPPHSELNLCFELVVAGTWDGHAQAGAPVGPDLFDVAIEGGATLLHASFAQADPRGQSFPLDYQDALGTASPAHPPRTGAAELDTLGHAGGDSVYRFSFAFAHSAPSVRFVFSSANLEGASDESWGLDTVYVGTEPCTSCTSSDAMELVVDELPEVDAGSPTGACVGETVTLSEATAGAADTFSWSDGGAGGTFDPSADVLNPEYDNPNLGAHVLTLTAIVDATGCVSSDTVVVTIADRPVVDAGPDLDTCAGEGVVLSGADGGSADTFRWSDGGEGGTFTPNNRVLAPTYTHQRAGIYTLTFTASASAGGCSSSDTRQVQVNANPLVEAGTDKEGCANAPIPLDDAFAASGTTVQWSDGGAGGSFAPSDTVLEPTYTHATPGAYTLTLVVMRPSTGCTSTDALAVTVHPAPSVSAGADKSTCAGDPRALSDATSSSGSPSWTDNGAGGTFSPSSTALNPSYTNPTPGTYTLALSSTTTDGCQATDTLVMTVSPNPAVNAGADKEACASQPVALSDASSTGDTFTWSDGGAGGVFEPSASVLRPTYRHASAGTRTLTLTSSTAATGCQRADSLVVTVRVLPVAAFAPIGGPFCEDVPVCFDNTSTGGTSWSWDFGTGGSSADFEPCFTYSEPGTYTVTLTALNVCGSDPESRQVVVQPKPIADFTFSTQGNRFCKDRPVDFVDESTSSPTSWQWDFGDGSTSTQQNPSHAYATDGLFIVELRACNACGCGPPRFKPVEIQASCQTNCEGNSNQINCNSGSGTHTGNTCSNHDSFNTTSYPCAPGIFYTGENRIHDLNFPSGANFIVRVVETAPEPNGYDLDVMISNSCNPPSCVAWGDEEVVYSDRTAANDDYWVIVDGRDGTCGPYRLEVQCLDGGDTAQCSPPVFAGITAADDVNPCTIPGIAVTWPAVSDWGDGPDGQPCPDGVFEILRAPAGDPADETNVGSAPAGATSFLDLRAVPQEPYVYRVHAVNSCCAEPALTTVTDGATDDFGNPIETDAGTGGTVTCNAPTVQLLGSASGGTGQGFTYHWTPTAGLSNPDVPNPVATAGGTYTLTVTDVGDGCTGTDTVVVVGDNEIPVASAGPDRLLTCTTTSVTLQGTVSGGNSSGGYSWSWSPAALVSDPAAPSPTTSTPATYTLTVTALATGCSDTDVVVVTQSVTPPVANAGPNAELTCAVTQVQLQGGASGGDGAEGYLFGWSPAAGLDDPSSATPTASAPGTYTLTVTDVRTGCTDTDAVVVGTNDLPPLAVAGPDRALPCSGAAVTLDGDALGGDGTDGYSFAWSPPEAVSDAAAENPTTTVPGTYTLTVTDVRTGCTDTDTVVVSADPASPLADAGPSREITCLSGTVTLQGSASGGDSSQGYTYAWTPAADVSDPASPSPTTSTPGSYTLTVTSIADGCSGSDAVLVRDLAGPPLANAGPDRTLTCAASTVSLAGSAGGSDGRDGWTFAWEPAADVSDPSAASPTTSTPGTYTLTVTDVYTGCTDTDTVAVLTDTAAPVAEAGPSPTLTCANVTVTLQGSASGGNGSAGYSFAWSPAGDVSDPSSATPSVSLPGTYTLTVTDLANGCTHQDSVVVGEDVAAPTANAGPDRTLACGAAGVTLNGSASGGNGSQGYTFRWEPASAVTNASAAVTDATAAGTFTLTVTDVANGCTDTDTVVVTSTGAPTVDAGPDGRITCDDASAPLQGSVSGGNGSQGFTYQWSPSAGVANPNALVTSTTVAATYSLVVTDVATGCRSTDWVLIADATEAPVAEAGPSPRLTCDEPTATLQGSASGGDGSQGYTYAWSPPGSVSNPSSPTPTTSTPGTYTLAVTSVATGCTDTDTAVVDDGRAPPVAAAGPDQIRDCAHPVVTLAGAAGGGDGSQGYLFSWSPAAPLSDAASATPTTSAPGTYTLTVTDVATGCTDTDAVVVTEDFATPAASAGPDGVMDCEHPLVTLSGSASGGNGSRGYTYEWSPAEDVSNPVSPTPVALAPGTFTLTVTDRANGCTDTDTVLVVDHTVPPVADAGPQQLIDCDSTVVTLTGSASGGEGSMGYAYSWEPSGDVATPEAASTETSTPGAYSLTVTDLATGCTSTDTVTVVQDIRAPHANAGPNRHVTCAAPTAALAGSATGGNATQGYAFRWEPAAQVADPDSASTTTTVPGTYTLRVTALATGCTDTDTMVVTSDLAAPVANAGLDDALDCLHASVVLRGSASGGNASQGYAYAWTPAAGLSDPNVAQPTATQPGVYTLTVTAVASGCTATDVVEVRDATAPPLASAGPDPLLDCDSSLVTLEGSASGGDGSQGYAYAWSPPGAVSNPSVARPTTATTGTYTVTVTDVATGCTDTDTVTVARDERRPVASAGPDRTLDCATTVVTLDGSASGGNASEGYTYAWQPAGAVSDPALRNPTTSAAGTFTLTVTAVATGCTDTDNVVVVRNDAPPVADAGPDLLLDCADAIVTLQGAASGGDGALGYAYAWSPAGDVSDPTAASPSTTRPGTYTLTVTDLANHCTAADTVVVDEDVAAPVADAGPDVVLDCSAPTVTLSGGASGGNGSQGYAYAWEPAGAVTDPTAAVTEATASGTFTLTVRDLANGCVDTDTVLVSSNVTPPVSEAGPPDSISCTDTVASLQGSASGGDGSQGYATTWSPSAGVADPTALVTTTTVPGTYTLVVHDIATGCRSADTVLVADDRDPPVAEAGPAKALTCSASSVTLEGGASGGSGASGYAYAWEPAADVSDPAAAQPTTSVAGTYTLTVTDLANGCVGTDQVLVTLDREAPIADAGPGKVLGCNGSVTLEGAAGGGNAAAGYAYSWSPAGDVSDPSVAQPTTSVAGTYTLTVTAVATGCTDTDTVTVTADSTPPVADAGPAREVSCLSPTVVLEGAASGGNGSLGYAYAWSPEDAVSDSTIAQPTTSAPGVFELTVTDLANGCTSSDTVLVSADLDPPTADAGPDAILDCHAPSVPLAGSASGGDGSQGYTFAWEPAAAVTDPSSPSTGATAAGVYTLTVTSVANGCADTDTVTVTLSQDPPVANAGPDGFIRCDRPSASLQGSASGGDGRQGYTASWTPTAGVANPAAFSTSTTQPGTYTLTVTDVFTGCRSFDTVTIGSDTRVPTANAGLDGVVTCTAQSVLNGSASGGNGSQGYVFQWTPTDGVLNPNSPTTTTSEGAVYTLTVTDRANGCVATDTVTVVADNEPPVATAGPDKVVNCIVPIVILDGGVTGGNGSAGYSFSWTPAANLSNPTSATPTTSTAGTYTVTVTDLATGCSDTDAVRVTVNRTPPSVSAGADQTLTCASPVATLSGTPTGATFTYAWSPAANVSDPAAQVTTTAVPGVYSLTVTNVTNGCSATDFVVVNDQRTPPDVTAGPDRVLTCAVTSAVLEGAATGGVGTLTYDWQPAAFVSDPAAAQPSVSNAGTYTLTVTDAATGCTAVDTVDVTLDQAAPVAGAGADKVVSCTVSSVVLDGSASGGNGGAGYAFLWQPAAGLSDPTVAQPTATGAGAWTLTVTDLANGCASTDDVSVIADVAPPVADAGPGVVLDCASVSVPLAGSASGGNGGAGYDVRWEPAAAVSDPDIAATSALAAGTFTLTVTDLANGCVDTDEVIVTSAGAPQVSAGPDTGLRCSDATAVLRGVVSGGDDSAGREVRWTPTAGVADPTALVTTTTVPATYSLVVLDLATGCRSADSVVVADVAPQPVVKAGPDVAFDCDSTQVFLAGSVTGGDDSAGRLVAWTPAGQVSDPASLTPEALGVGTYTLTVTDLATGCTQQDSVEVTDDHRPPVAEAGPTLAIACDDPTPALQGGASGGNGSLGYLYSWTPADGVTDPTSATPGALRPGTFTLTVTDAFNACTATDTVDVTRDASLPAASAGPDRVLDCDTASVSLTGSVTGGDGALGFQFRWEPAADVASPTAPSTSTTIPGTYTLTVTDRATGCLSVDTVTVTIDTPPAPVEPSALLLRPGAEPLRVVKAGAQLRVTWEAVPAELVHRLHQGTLAGLHATGYDHTYLACALAAPQHQFAMPTGSRYYLASSANCAGDESSYGRNSLGAERPNDLAASGRACP